VYRGLRESFARILASVLVGRTDSMDGSLRLPFHCSFEPLFSFAEYPSCSPQVCVFVALRRLIHLTIDAVIVVTLLFVFDCELLS